MHAGNISVMHFFFYQHRFLFYHKCLLNSKVVVDDFSQGGQAVGGAGGITTDRRTDILLSNLLVSDETSADGSSEELYTECAKQKYTTKGKTLEMVPDDGHGGGVIFVLIDPHDEHWSIR